MLAGVSAGTLCWFNDGLTDSYGGLEPLRDGLGIIEASACPHYDGEPGRRATYHRLIAAGMQSGYAADDGAALHFHGQTLVEAVSSRPHAGAYRVELVGKSVTETRLPSAFSESGMRSPLQAPKTCLPALAGVPGSQGRGGEHTAEGSYLAGWWLVAGGLHPRR